ncbi:hypothetical protein [Streptomyces sp. NPDC001282]|uniref:hypothetical protein n=1 Tax=Streptomyces sp. NPDC001282 TaxID=3364557 RepID=UPI00367D8A45
MAKRLTSLAPLIGVEDWARCCAVEKVFGIEPGPLNGDRPARALDALAQHPEHIAGAGDRRVRDRCGPDAWGHDQHVRARGLPGRVRARTSPPVIGYGYPKDRRFDLKQVQAGPAVSADGGIPLHACAVRAAARVFLAQTPIR